MGVIVLFSSFLVVSLTLVSGQEECIIADTRRDLVVDVEASQKLNVNILLLGELTIKKDNPDDAFRDCIDKCCTIGKILSLFIACKLINGIIYFLSNV
jgi:hypothetical protein